MDAVAEVLCRVAVTTELDFDVGEARSDRHVLLKLPRCVEGFASSFQVSGCKPFDASVEQFRNVLDLLLIGCRPRGLVSGARGDGPRQNGHH